MSEIPQRSRGQSFLSSEACHVDHGVPRSSEECCGVPRCMCVSVGRGLAPTPTVGHGGSSIVGRDAPQRQKWILDHYQSPHEENGMSSFVILGHGEPY